MQRVACFGDLSGHFDPLQEQLEALGVTFDNDFVHDWPKDLAVIQVGDLIHKGPDSKHIVNFVDHILRDLPWVSWTQLMGNHESQYLGGAGFWRNLIPPESQKILHSWLEDNHIHAAAAITTDDGQEFLVTHGGLGFMNWKQRYRKLSAPAVAAKLNEFRDAMHAHSVGQELKLEYAAILSDVYAPGMMLGENHPEPGVTWAEARVEVRLPWIRGELRRTAQAPFHQVHGHSNGLRYMGRGQGFIVPVDLMDTTIITKEGFTHTTLPSGKLIIGIDPNATKGTPKSPIPFVVQGSVST